jgi:hypothetical protein
VQYLTRGSCTRAAQREAEILSRLRSCSQVIGFLEAFHCQFHTILVTEFVYGEIV